MSYDYERYDGKRIVVDGEIVGLLAMEFGHEVEEVWEEYHAELAMTEEQERQSEAYKESLRRALSAQYEKVATLDAENAKLREELSKWERLTAGIDLPEHPVTQFKPKDLERENAKLREEIEAAKHDLQVFSMGSVQLEADNAKLRELARHMRTCMEHYEVDGTISCDRCPLDNDTGNCDFERRMSELGVVK